MTSPIVSEILEVVKKIDTNVSNLSVNFQSMLERTLNTEIRNLSRNILTIRDNNISDIRSLNTKLDQLLENGNKYKQISNNLDEASRLINDLINKIKGKELLDNSTDDDLRKQISEVISDLKKILEHQEKSSVLPFQGGRDIVPFDQKQKPKTPTKPPRFRSTIIPNLDPDLIH